MDNVHNSPRPNRNSRAAGLRKLHKHAPHLLPQVTSGALSVNKALIEAGLRERTVTVPLSHPEKPPASCGGTSPATNSPVSPSC
ncbi:hypothetical protein ACFC4G_38885 [Streptomyces sp. NPDC056002]|uniref:hypothetical protein n=1 Tax=Streptomyces sp. NPDC056002 TaxID=3345675 RepID=UPI0035E34283